MTDKLTRVRILHDDDASDPRQDCNVGYICNLTDRFDVRELRYAIWRTNLWLSLEAMYNATHNAPDDDPFEYLEGNDIESKEELRSWIERVNEHDAMVCFTFNTDSADYVAYCPEDRWRKEFATKEDALRAIEAEVETFIQWCEGDVYGFVIEEADPQADEDEEPEWDQVDSCWGFYGSDVETNGMLDHIPEELHEQARKAEVEYEHGW